MTTVIVDYESGNLHSVAKSFERMARETGAGAVLVSSDPADLARASRIVLPGVGAFADCRAGLSAREGLFEAMEARVLDGGVPFLGICVGMQMLADWGREHGVETRGFGWIAGDVVDITPDDPALKVPHMGWNELVITTPHPVLKGIEQGAHAYFVHSYHLAAVNANEVLAHVDYGSKITAVVGRDNIIGTQFHPEKSQKTGLGLIANFLKWAP
ncbi:MAG: imidazole glycerol phosphate synthase subunit HisH [Paracoccaceae bacterium]